MRRWAALLGVLAIGRLGVDAASHATFALWPQQIDATLSLSIDREGASVVEASHGGAISTFNMIINTQPEMPLDPLIDTLEITWVPTTDTQSSTFDQFFASSSRIDRMNAVGIHLQVKLRDGSSWSVLDDTHHERIEENIRGVLQNSLPSIEILPNLPKGFLAKSLCDFRTWKTSNPLEEILREPAAKSLSLCFSSSFPFSKDEAASFYTTIIHGAKDDSVDSENSVIERTLYETKRGLSKDHHELRLARMKIGRGSDASVNVEAEYLEVWVARSSTVTKPWRGVFPTRDTKSDVLIVTSITQQLGLDKLEHIWLQQDGKPISPRSPPAVLDIQVPKAVVAASLQASIAGEGFHRRYVMDVEIHESDGRASENKTILVRVPVSSTSYIDLDEIRRMERFGELKLLSFTKHIEIERPSPVSSQHEVGLEFTMPTTNQVHIEFPIHFRYQAPSESALYREASVTAPDIFLFCRNGDLSAKEKVKLSDDDAIERYFQTWGISDQAAPRSDSHWIRLATVSPLPVMVVLTPVGYLPSDWLVSSVTLLFACMGAALLLWVSIGVANRAQISSGDAGANWKRKTD